MARETGVQPLRNVLVCLDRSAMAEAVIGHALAVAAAYDATVTVFHVLEPRVNAGKEPPDPVEWELRRHEANRYLIDFTARARSGARVNLTTEISEGDPVVQIRRWVIDHDVDLVVLCTHGRRGRAEWPLASTARKLVDVLRCSLLVVPGTVPAAAGALTYRRLLVPLDGSVWSETALSVAVHLAREHGAEILLVHAVVKPELFGFGPVSVEDLDCERRVLERNERVAREYLDAVRERLTALDLNVRTLVERDGNVRTMLSQVVAREEPDLLLFSACGMSGHVEGPCGTVAAHLLAHAETPALMLRETHERILARSKRRTQTAPRMPTLAGP